MKNVLLILFLVSASFSLQLKSLHQATLQASSSFENKLRKVREDNEMSGLLIDLASIHMSTEGPLEDLIKAIGDLIQDISNSIDKENLLYEDQTSIHEDYVSKLQQDLDSVKSLISETTFLLESQLRPRKQQVESTIDQLQGSITKNLETTDKETASRARDHKEFVQKDREYDEAIKACNEAIDLMEKLKSGELVFIQTPHAPDTMKKVLTSATNLNNNKYSLFLEALSHVGKGFTDQEVVSQVLKLLKDLLNNLHSGREELNHEEEEARKQWEEVRLPQLLKERENLNKSLSENLTALEILESK